MVTVKRMVLDVLKPHQPNALDFAKSIADIGIGCCVHLTVMEVDEKTETLQVEVVGDSLDFDAIQTSISDMGGSLHSIDEVEVLGELGVG